MTRFVPLLLLASLLTTASTFAADAPPASPPVPIEFIDTSFENASPLWYEFAADGTVMVNLNYDHERNSPNRAAGHFHFRLQAPKGRKLTLEFKNLDNVWNGRPGSVAKEIQQVVISQDGKNWTPVPTESPESGRVRVTLEMPADALLVARAEPYRLSDLNRFIDEIKASPLVKISIIGKTVQGRDLEIIRVGRAEAPNRVFLRASAQLHALNGGGQNQARCILTGALGSAQVGLSGIPHRFLDGHEKSAELSALARQLGEQAAREHS
jgi:hypothetical protein